MYILKYWLEVETGLCVYTLYIYYYIVVRQADRYDRFIRDSVPRAVKYNVVLIIIIIILTHYINNHIFQRTQFTQYVVTLILNIFYIII